MIEYFWGLFSVTAAKLQQKNDINKYLCHFLRKSSYFLIVVDGGGDELGAPGGEAESEGKDDPFDALVKG